MKNIFTLLFLIILFNSCKKEEETIIKTEIPKEDSIMVAAFNPSIVYPSDSIAIIDLENKSKFATSYKWYLNNDLFSTSFNSSILYKKNDTLDIKLVCYNISKNDSVTLVKKIVINGIITTTPKADFHIDINVDSLNYYKFTNLSTNYTKNKWYFDDGTTSNEISPTHFYSSLGTHKTKLVVEDNIGKVDSITINADNGNRISVMGLAFKLDNISPVSYTFYNVRLYTESGFVTSILFGDEINKIPTSFTDYKSHNYADGLPHTVKLISSNGNVTKYEIKSTFDINDVNSILTQLKGEYDFTNRYNGNKTYNDTTLYINNFNSELRLRDSTLKHYFDCKLTSYTDDINFVFQDKIQYLPGTFSTSKFVFKKGTNKMEANLIFNGVISSYSSYSGTKR